MNVQLRKANIHDSQRLFEWRNEPSTIPWMGTTRALSFEEHQTWFDKVLSDSDWLLLIVEVNLEAVGQIRYQKILDKAKVSINITQKMHGKGIASQVFKQGSELVRSLGFAEHIYAYVQLDNIGSIKAMKKAGFVCGATQQVHCIEHLVMHDVVQELL